MSNRSQIVRRSWTLVGIAVIAIVVASLQWFLPASSAAPPGTLPASLPATMPAAPGRLSVIAFNPVDAGRYLVKITGCNECHTPGWESGEAIPEARWLMGVPVGYRGPWGTTYATNLRLYVQTFTPDTWTAVMRRGRRGLDAVGQPACAERCGPAGDLRVHQEPGPGGVTDAGVRAGGRRTEDAVHCFPSADADSGKGAGGDGTRHQRVCSAGCATDERAGAVKPSKNNPGGQSRSLPDRGKIWLA